MRRLVRPTPPARIDPSRAEAAAQLCDWYDDPNARDHWNDLERGERPVREALRTMSGDRCAWCEEPLGKSLEVEHYLPQKHFPWLRYCWANLLPACGACNSAKRAWHPEKLVGRALVDPCLQGRCTGEPYVPSVVLAGVDDRLLEPAVDDPAEHLTFSPCDGTWAPRSGVGQCTIAKLFSDASYSKRIQQLSELARNLARDRTSEESLRSYLGAHGRETVFRALLDYWQQFYPPKGAAP